MSSSTINHGIDTSATNASSYSDELRLLTVAEGLKAVQRANLIASGARRENSAEHSWHAAIAAIVLAGMAPEGVNIERVVAMLLVHDLVEVIAGDHPDFWATGDDGARKSEREQQACASLFCGNSPANVLFGNLWREFDAGASPDARFAIAIDKLMPLVIQVIGDGRSWDNFSIDRESYLRAKIQIAHGSSSMWTFAQTLAAEGHAKGWLK